MPLKASITANAMVSPRPVRRIVQSTKSESSENSSKDNFRIAMMGSGGVGKSTIIEQFLHLTILVKRHNCRPKSKLPTKPPKKSSAEEMHHLEFSKSGQTVTIELLDTSGYHSFPAMRELAIRQAQAFILVCSMEFENSFDYVRELHQEIIRIKNSQNTLQPPIVVVANKSDLPKTEWKFDLTYAELVVQCDWEDCGFVACSAHDNNNIRGIFSEMISQIKASLRKDKREPKALQDVNRRGSMPNFLQVPASHIKRTPSFPRKTKPANDAAAQKQDGGPGCLVQ